MSKRSRLDDEALSKVNTRAAVDPEYRQRLLTDPRAAIQEALGQAPAEGLNIQFVEKAPGVDALFVLPDAIPEGDKLSAEELEAVAGGWNVCITATSTQNNTKPPKPKTPKAIDSSDGDDGDDEDDEE